MPWLRASSRRRRAPGSRPARPARPSARWCRPTGAPTLARAPATTMSASRWRWREPLSGSDARRCLAMDAGCGRGAEWFARQARRDQEVDAERRRAMGEVEAIADPPAAHVESGGKHAETRRIDVGEFRDLAAMVEA